MSRAASGDVARFDFTHRLGDGGEERSTRDVAVEAPVAIEINGIAFAVMMASPTDLDDFGVGFARAEGLLDGIREIGGLQVAEVPAGWIVRLSLVAPPDGRLAERIRRRVTESACGLCGMESLGAVARQLPRVAGPVAPTQQAVARALEQLPARQELARRTAAAHAAALCEPDGTIVLSREDVGRHNALDKLVGAAMRSDVPLTGRFALVTSRLSFELVEKAAIAGIGGLVALSAPTTLALERAAEVQLPVVTCVRGQSMLTDPVRWRTEVRREAAGRRGPGVASALLRETIDENGD
jgi:FdhD protein